LWLITSFEKRGSALPNAIEILETTFGYCSFRDQQQSIVEHVIAGHDALVLMPTGGGKSLCYQIPALARDGLAIIVSHSLH
jgi:ATP-dependent DNA helicase RecQ (EC 3.6.1.-)